MTTKEELLKFGTYSSYTNGHVDPDWGEKMQPVAIYVFRGRLVAVEWFAEEHGYFIDDENIASVAHRIEIK